MSLQNPIWQFATAGNIKFGRGCLEWIPDELRRFGVNRPLVVTDRRVAVLPSVAKLIDQLRDRIPATTVFTESIPEPSIETADAAIAVGRASIADGVIGIGGGSNLDVAKMTAVVLRHGGSPSNYFGFDAIPGPILPLFAIPTTAGTGSEVSHSAVLTDPAAQVKVSTLSRWLRPNVAVIDPSLTDSCPATVTAHSGIDALVHAVEALTNRDYRQMVGVDPQARAYEGSYPFTRLIAGEAIRLIGRFLTRAFRSPEDREARDGMALAAMLAGMAFSNSGVALVHALEYPIGVLTHCSHGEGNGLLLPHVMRFNLNTSPETFAAIAAWLEDPSSEHVSSNRSSEAAIEAVVKLQHSLGIRTHLRDLGLSFEQLPAIALRAFQIKRLMDVNPRRPTEADLLTILENAY